MVFVALSSHKGPTATHLKDIRHSATPWIVCLPRTRLRFLSLRTVRHELGSGHIPLLDIPGLPLLGHWYVTHLRSKKLSSAARAFKEFLIEQGCSLMDAW